MERIMKQLIIVIFVLVCVLNCSEQYSFISSISLVESTALNGGSPFLDVITPFNPDENISEVNDSEDALIPNLVKEAEPTIQ